MGHGTLIAVFALSGPGNKLTYFGTLHIRWRHASSKQMHDILQATGVPQCVRKLVSDIIDTCRVCRMLQRPPPAHAATSRNTS
eukprot:7923072-Prorocentrum_lima.AAC.1